MYSKVTKQQYRGETPPKLGIFGVEGIKVVIESTKIKFISQSGTNSTVDNSGYGYDKK